MTLEIHDMTEKDLALAKERCADLFRDTPDMSLCAVIDGVHLGYLTAASISDGRWHLLNMWVEPHHRRKGVASALLAQMFEHIGDTFCTLSVESDNDKAIPLYKREGFRFTSSRSRTGFRMMVRDPAAE